LEGGIDEKDLPAVLLADSGEGDHGNAELGMLNAE
jgi:hypothetical protein